MKKTVYILAFTFLGILLQFILHAVLEIWYIGLLLADFPRYSFGFSWAQWFGIHAFFTLVLLLAGVGFGFWQGQYWWRQIYVFKRRWRQLNKQ